MTKFKCCICGKESAGYGNNPHPFEGDKCCDECNLKRVIPKRMELMRGVK